MMRPIFCSVLLFATAVGPVGAQAVATDSAAPRMRQRIEARFREVAREELGLTDQQADRVWAIQSRNYDRQAEILREEKRLTQVLGTQLRPGVAADPAQVTRALDSLGALRAAQGRSFAEEQREFATFLTPVQRAQLYRLRARINGRVAEVIDERRRIAPGRPAPARRP